MVRLHFHPDAVEHNVAAIRRLATAAAQPPTTHNPDAAINRTRPPNAPALCAVLKANAYALGITRLLPPIIAAGVDAIATFSPEEAANILPLTALPVLVLGPSWNLDQHHDRTIHAALANARLHLVAHDLHHARHLAATARQLVAKQTNLPRLPIHIEIDTGLGRGGTHPDRTRAIVELINNDPHLKLAGILTHFADAIAPAANTHHQQQTFARVIASVVDILPNDCIIHQTSTTTLLANAARPLDLIRIGLGLFGIPGPDQQPPTASNPQQLRGALSLTAPIALIRDLPPGSPIGYAGTFVTTRPTRIAIVPVGYAHGYPRSFRNPPLAAIRHRTSHSTNATPRHQDQTLAPVVGRVSMDQLAIDITDIPPALLPEPATESTVELISHDNTSPLALHHIAAAADMIPHELICHLGAALRPHTVTTPSNNPNLPNTSSLSPSP